MDVFLSLTLLTQPQPTHLLGWATKNRPIPVGVEPAVIATTPPVRLSDTEIQQRLENLPGWTTDGETLFYEATFEDFVAAIAFVNSLVEPAEALGHHPDITINYNRVVLKLTTHDAGGLTELDFQLAAAISHR